MGKFEDQLLSDLLREHGPALAAAERSEERNTRPIWVAAGAVVLAGAVTAGVALVSGGTPAFAVSQNSDGSITVSIKDIAAIAPANKELERLGVPIRAVPTRPDCPSVPASSTGGSAGGGNQPGEPVPPDARPSASVGESQGASVGESPGGMKPEFTVDLGPGGGVTIERSAITPGSNIALGVFTTPNGEVSSMSFAKNDGPMPDCLPSGPPQGRPGGGN